MVKGIKTWTVSDWTAPVWILAITDVAMVLDYPDLIEYNFACKDKPREVRRRIRALPEPGLEA